jgi:hypothetical protein
MHSNKSHQKAHPAAAPLLALMDLPCMSSASSLNIQFCPLLQIGLVFCLESTNKLQPAFVHDYGSIVATQIFKNLYS